MTDQKSQQDEVFDYQVTKDGKVLIYWNNRLVTTLANQKAQKFLNQIRQDGSDEQLIMARFTGNFKRGNEHDNKHSD
jgi:hypothetical protein